MYNYSRYIHTIFKNVGGTEDYDEEKFDESKFHESKFTYRITENGLGRHSHS